MNVDKIILQHFIFTFHSSIDLRLKTLTSFLEQLLKEEHEGEVPMVLIILGLHPAEGGKLRQTVDQSIPPPPPPLSLSGAELSTD